MKGLKPTFISILAIGLLAGSTVGVAAQEESILFHGTSRVLDYTDFGEKTVIEDGLVLEELRGQTTEGVIETTNDRVTGTTYVTVNQDTHLMQADKVQPQVTQWGTQRIENDGGAWECTWSGGEMQFMLVQRLMWCVGEGGYAGHSMRMMETNEADGGSIGITVTGLEWLGELPPLPAAPEPSSD